MKRIVIISDTQLPYHDDLAVNNLIKFIHQWRPDHVIHIGDLMDYPTPARWSKDTRAEFAGSVKNDSEIGKGFLGAIRDGYHGPFDVVEGNHDLRPAAYLENHAPALAEYPFDVGTLLDFDSHGVNLVKGFLDDFAPGWTATHGHLGFTLSQIGGRTALLGAVFMRRNVVMGHTHRLGIMGESFGYAGNITTQWGMEVGHLMDIKSAHYLKKGAANWQQGFGLFYVDGEDVRPEVVPIFPNGTFIVDGYRFGEKR